MELCNKSIISGNNNTMTLPITEDEYKIGVLAWENGAYIQNAFPMLNADEREFILTGITPDEWETL